MFPGADPGFQVIGDVLKKVRAKIFGGFCHRHLFHSKNIYPLLFLTYSVKNRDLMQKIIFFPILWGGGGAGCQKHKVAFAMNHY